MLNRRLTFNCNLKVRGGERSAVSAKSRVAPTIPTRYPQSSPDQASEDSAFYWRVSLEDKSPEWPTSSLKSYRTISVGTVGATGSLAMAGVVWSRRALVKWFCSSLCLPHRSLLLLFQRGLARIVYSSTNPFHFESYNFRHDVKEVRYRCQLNRYLSTADRFKDVLTSSCKARRQLIP
ncbi:unnamed protein product [Nezara viridula]|uniref:Uncharacterized protein n=1 Tax=Nezara viridula TaxID=85310 RepID=A0A9P0HSS1_NEZVI|nr:unnamed protein product [Nezara viridula]